MTKETVTKSEIEASYQTLVDTDNPAAEVARLILIAEGGGDPSVDADGVEDDNAAAD